ncbi:ABC transporter ATP-binding protein [Alteromonas sediminis]|uniref:ABC transporter ATP-binding protein n=1 Tax=Alteromonas sediminis TaxID=2259342 RepID=A0A3N5YQT7_9ALTE|nr:ABC transporter ATP-binding protein [Alteromonas sediminis]RPJ68621.1 ABC transporter ATP-binding protein [Alteromonas sediminis]
MIDLSQLSVPNRLQVTDLQFAARELTLLLGENGAGKSTLLSALAGIHVSDDSIIHIFDKPIQDWPLASLATFRAWLGQQTHSHFSITVEEMLSFFAQSHHTPDWFDWLDCLEITAFMNRQLDSLSGGEFQRVQLARVLLQAGSAIDEGQAIVLLDEPLAALDLRFQYVVMDLLKRLRDKGNCVVISSHHPEFATGYADNVLMLKKGQVIAQGRSENVVCADKLSQCYGVEPETLARYFAGNN